MELRNGIGNGQKIYRQTWANADDVTSNPSLGPRPKTNPSADRFYTGSDIRAGWGLGMRLVKSLFRVFRSEGGAHWQAYGPEFPTSQNFYEGNVQVWRPDSCFPRDLGTRLTKSRVCRSRTRANSMYMQNFSLGWQLTLQICGFLWKFFPQNLGAWHP